MRNCCSYVLEGAALASGASFGTQSVSTLVLLYWLSLFMPSEKEKYFAPHHGMRRKENGNLSGVEDSFYLAMLVNLFAVLLESLACLLPALWQC